MSPVLNSFMKSVSLPSYVTQPVTCSANVYITQKAAQYAYIQTIKSIHSWIDEDVSLRPVALEKCFEYFVGLAYNIVHAVMRVAYLSLILTIHLSV